MRSILLAAVLATTTFVTSVRVADACGGGYGSWQPPLTARTIVRPAVSPEKKQTFAILSDRLDAKRGKKVKFTELDRRSFDATKTAPKGRTAQPTRLTLLGPTGAKTVEIADTLWVDLAFDQDAPREAVALPDGDFFVALDGHHADATWVSFDVIHGSTVTTHRGDGLQIMQHHGGSTFEVNQLSLEGRPVGIVKVRGLRYIAVQGNAARNRDTWLVQI
ncbi:MAG: hypothetical protein ACKV2T_11330 [Kofleriaceae bacterium]